MEIKIDKSTLPKDGQYVWFKLPDLREYYGCYLGNAELFNTYKHFFTIWEVMEWEPCPHTLSNFEKGVWICNKCGATTPRTHDY
jgi:hypothetical protein